MREIASMVLITFGLLLVLVCVVVALEILALPTLAKAVAFGAVLVILGVWVGRSGER